ncbi:hypothetical protein Sjap_026621 [Stephania japonica]|uniref:Uncharacterized protein n=1 Tax=Stephania japonica TaxID=461633 RepID=A0AAP0E271_9MAGN
MNRRGPYSLEESAERARGGYGLARSFQRSFDPLQPRRTTVLPAFDDWRWTLPTNQLSSPALAQQRWIPFVESPEIKPNHHPSSTGARERHGTRVRLSHPSRIPQIITAYSWDSSHSTAKVRDFSFSSRFRMLLRIGRVEFHRLFGIGWWIGIVCCLPLASSTNLISKILMGSPALGETSASRPCRAYGYRNERDDYRGSDREAGTCIKGFPGTMLSVARIS